MMEVETATDALEQIVMAYKRAVRFEGNNPDFDWRRFSSQLGRIAEGTLRPNARPTIVVRL